MNTYWISLPCDLLSSLASFQCSLLHHLHLSSDLGLSKYVNQHSHLDLSRNVRLPVLYDLDFNRRHWIAPNSSRQWNAKSKDTKKATTGFSYPSNKYPKVPEYWMQSGQCDANDASNRKRYISGRRV